MYLSSTNVLGQPPTPVQVTVTDWLSFLGRDGQTSTPPLPTPGQILRATSPIYGPAEFMLAYGVAGLQIGESVRIGDLYATTRAVAGTRGIMGVSMSANTSPLALSWFAIRGLVPTRVAAAVAANSPLFLTATAGSLDDAVVAGDNVVGAFAATAQSATVTTKTVNTVSSSPLITVPDINGLYVGMGIAGTGIPGGATITAIGYGGLMLGFPGPQALQIQISANATATGNPVATFAHPATFCTAALNFPQATGAI